MDILVGFNKPIGFFKFIELEDHLTKLIHPKLNLISPGTPILCVFGCPFQEGLLHVCHELFYL